MGIEDEANEIRMNPSELIAALTDNREIEFQLHNHMYFASPRTTFSQLSCYGVLDCVTKRWIFVGSPIVLLDFVFPGGFTLRDNFDEFEFLYIL